MLTTSMNLKRIYLVLENLICRRDNLKRILKNIFVLDSTSIDAILQNKTNIEFKK